MKKAFTLVEILVVITIIGLISTLALVFLKDTAEIKALSYTKKVMSSIKQGVSDTDSRNYFAGFVNDFGTMPPHAYFLTGDSNGSFNFVGGELSRHRFISMTQQSGTSFPAPFMPEDTILDGKINRVLFVGFHGGYMSRVGERNEESFYDGWNTPMVLINDFNISTNGESFLMLKSAGSDRSFNNAVSLIREEFDLSKDIDSLEDFYADDFNQTYRRSSFIMQSLDINIRLDIDDANEAAILIYSPMLYYAEGSENEVCIEHNTTHARCNTNHRRYLPYYPFDRHNTGLDIGIEDKNVSWHIGLIKHSLYFNDKNESRMFINQKGTIGTNAYDFNSSNFEISDSSFFGNIFVDINNTSYASFSKDINNPFYMYAGSKVISIWYNNGSGWSEQESFIQDFRPNSRSTIRDMSN